MMIDLATTLCASCDSDVRQMTAALMVHRSAVCRFYGVFLFVIV